MAKKRKYPPYWTKVKTYRPPTPHQRAEVQRKNRKAAAGDGGVFEYVAATMFDTTEENERRIGKLGAASDVRRIDPVSGEVVEVIAAKPELSPGEKRWKRSQIRRAVFRKKA